MKNAVATHGPFSKLSASRAIDGNVSSCSAAYASSSPWLRVDLKTVYLITSVEVLFDSSGGDGAVVRVGSNLFNNGNVKWNRPNFPNGIIRSYTVIYQKAAAEKHDLYKVIVVKSNSLLVNLTDLQDSVSYIVWVRVLVSAILIRMHSFKFRFAL